MKDFKSFKEAAKWYSHADDIDKDKGGKKGSYMEDDYDQSTGTYANHAPGYYGDDDRDPDDDDYDGDGDYDDYSGGGGGYYGGDDYEPPFQDPRYRLDPKAEFTVGDDIVYVGNTGGKRYQEGKIRRVRDDGKYVVKFADKKLIAISKHQLRQKMDEEIYKAKLKEYEDKKAAKKLEREAKKKEQEELAKLNPTAVKSDYVPGQKWWEKK